jgi:ribose-phosphate pyrophosphokinase
MAEKTLVIIGKAVSRETVDYFKADAGYDMAPLSLGHFQSGENFCELFYGEESSEDAKKARLKDKEVLVVQSAAAPVAEMVMELLQMIHTAKFYGARKVTVMMPFAPFARQDRSFDKRLTSVANDLFVKQLKAAGADAVMTFTPHSAAAIGQYEAEFKQEFTALSTGALFAESLRDLYHNSAEGLMVGAPDGANKPNDMGQLRASELRGELQKTFNAVGGFFIGKEHTATSDTKITTFQGDVLGKDCVIVDDMVDGGSTMVNAAEMLKAKGAKSVTICFTHAVLTGPVLEKMLLKSKAIDRIVMTDTIPDAIQKVNDFDRVYPDASSKIMILPWVKAFQAKK